jgi:hypothetical protein
MNQINYQKIVLFTLLRLIGIASIFFLINNWVQFKTLLSGTILPFEVWMAHAFKPSQVVMILLLGVIFFMKDLKKQRESIENNQNQ